MTAHIDSNPSEVLPMSNEQSQRLELLARIDQLDRLADEVTDPDTLERIKAHKKALRHTLDKLPKTP